MEPPLNIMTRIYTEHMREMNRLWRLRNLDSIKEKQRAYSKKKKEKMREYSREYYLKNRENILKRVKLYYKKNKPKVLQYLRGYQTIKTKTDIHYHLARRIRSRMKHAIVNGAKTGSGVQDLGCSIPFLKKYIESQFEPGMNWENWNLYGWHLDHKKPLKMFDLDDREEFLAACHYTNLQPMWAKKNLSKGARFIS